MHDILGPRVDILMLDFGIYIQNIVAQPQIHCLMLVTPRYPLARKERENEERQQDWDFKYDGDSVPSLESRKQEENAMDSSIL